jgi:hypothetical protein
MHTKVLRYLSSFARSLNELTAYAGKATRENLKTLIAYHEWVATLTDPAPILASIAGAKVAQ